MIAVTCDVDWAPDEILRDTLDLLASSGTKATIFATHRSPILEGLDPGQIEIGIHPHFDGRAPCEVLRELLALFPSAEGVRSHTLLSGSRLVLDFIACGLRYDCNLLLPGQPALRAFHMWHRFVRIPYFCDDALHCVNHYSWSLEDLPMDHEGLKVFNFHPLHLYLNTERFDRYEAARPFLRRPDRLAAFRNPEASGAGSRVLFRRLCEHVARGGLPTFLLREIAEGVPR